MTSSQLSSSVESVLSLVEKMTTALQWDSSTSNVSILFTTVDHLRSSSLSELTGHTESIQTEIVSVLEVTRTVVEECTIQSLSNNIKASLSKMSTLSHQLCHVARGQTSLLSRWELARVQCWRYQVLISLSPGLNDTDQCEETAALVDLVESGASLLRTMDSLLNDVHRLNKISGSMLLLCSPCC